MKSWMRSCERDCITRFFSQGKGEEEADEQDAHIMLKLGPLPPE